MNPTRLAYSTLSCTGTVLRVIKFILKNGKKVCILKKIMIFLLHMKETFKLTKLKSHFDTESVFILISQSRLSIFFVAIFSVFNPQQAIYQQTGDYVVQII